MKNKVGVIAFIALGVALSTGIDFWLGYRQGGSVDNGLAFVVFGFILLCGFALYHLIRNIATK
jgi:hypothetical protein